MSKYVCIYCNKSYIRKSAFNNHQINCKFIRICNNIKSKREIDEELDEKLDEEQELPIKFDGSINDIYKLLINLNNKFEKLQADYSEIKKYVNVTKNKIDIIQYLNINYDCSEFDFNKFLNSIQITSIELEKVFEKDYVDGIFQILVDYIEKNKCNNEIPIKAFNNKEGILYIYIKLPDSDKNWSIISEDQIKSIFKYFNKKLLPLFLEWKQVNEKQLHSDDFTLIYVKNMKRVLGTNFEKKNKNAMLQNKLYKYLKVNLKNYVSHDYE
tara:strand:- start:1798 stop:2604 length:807 start_codon:yes stop_codon:yes gene_type:complete